jgi:hypothetical protein
MSSSIQNEAAASVNSMNLRDEENTPQQEQDNVCARVEEHVEHTPDHTLECAPEHTPVRKQEQFRAKLEFFSNEYYAQLAKAIDVAKPRLQDGSAKLVKINPKLIKPMYYYSYIDPATQKENKTRWTWDILQYGLLKNQDTANTANTTNTVHNMSSLGGFTSSHSLRMQASTLSLAEQSACGSDAQTNATNAPSGANQTFTSTVSRSSNRDTYPWHKFSVERPFLRMRRELDAEGIELIDRTNAFISKKPCFYIRLK